MEWAARPGRVAFVEDVPLPLDDPADRSSSFWIGDFSKMRMDQRHSYTTPGANFLRGNADHHQEQEQQQEHRNGGAGGVGFLEGRAICYNLEASLRPPVALGFPEEFLPHGGSSHTATFQLKTCGAPNELNLAFYFIPGQEKAIVNRVTVTGDIPKGMLVDISPHGRDSYFVSVVWEVQDIYAVDFFKLQFVAEQEDTTSSSSNDRRRRTLFTSKSLYVEVKDDCPPGGGGRGRAGVGAAPAPAAEEEEDIGIIMKDEEEKKRPVTSRLWL